MGTKFRFLAVLLVVFMLLQSFGSASASSSLPDQSYLPYGMRVKVGTAIKYPPAPFSPGHGKPAQNTRENKNLVDHPGKVPLPLREVYPENNPTNSPIPEIEPGSGDAGIWLTKGEGIYSQNDAQTDFVIPGDAIETTVYAPTHMSAGGTCIETVTAHWYYEGMGGTAHGHGFWDWCGTDGSLGWQVFEVMDSGWVSAYVRKLNGEARYWTQVYSDSPGSWVGMLYNFSLGKWEVKTTISGTNQSGFGNTGWSMWESHHLMELELCPSFPNIQASGLKVYQNGAWVKVGTANSQTKLGPYGYCWDQGDYTLRLNTGGWLAQTR